MRTTPSSLVALALVVSSRSPLGVAAASARSSDDASSASSATPSPARPRRRDQGLAADAGRPGRLASRQSYGASGDQARAVAAGLRTDIVQLSTGLDVDLLVKAGLVDAKWNRQSFKGIATNSLVVFAVRDGNPKKIKTWDDLAEARRRHRDAEPALVRRREVERDGRLRRAATARQDRQAGHGLRREAVRERRLARHLGPQRDEHVPRGQGRRLHHVRERGAPREAAVRHPAPDAPDRGADRRAQDQREQGRREQFIRFTKTAAGAAHLRAVRLPAADRRPSTRSSRSSTRAGRASSGSTTSTSAAGPPSTGSGSTPTRASGSAIAAQARDSAG